MPSDAACSFPLGSCFSCGIPISVHFTFFLLLGLQVFDALTRYDDSLWYAIFLTVLYGPVLLVTIIVHELGHALVNRKFGGEAERIVLWPLGGYVLLGRTEGLGVMEDFWVAIAGPLTHVPQIAAWFGVYLIFNSPDSYKFEADASWDFDELKSTDGFITQLAKQAMLLNAALFVFNLFVPAYPMDGGRILAALLVQCGCRISTAAYVTSITALLLAAALGAWGVYDLLLDGDADGGAPLLLLLVAAWIALNSFNLLRMTARGNALDHALFNKECYRVADERFSLSAEEQEQKRLERELEMQQQEQRRKQDDWVSKQQEKRATKASARDTNHVVTEDNEVDEQRLGRIRGTEGVPAWEANASINQEPDDPALSPAGAGPSWSTFQSQSVSRSPGEPIPSQETQSRTPSKQGGLSRLFRKSGSKKGDQGSTTQDNDWFV